MKLFKHVSKRAALATAAVLATAAIAIPAAVMAGLGSDRPTKAYTGEGTAGFDHVTFNSMTNVPNIGDERDFLHGKISGAPGGFYDPMNGVRSGDEILVRVYVHNNADPSHNASGKGVAKNTRVRVHLPTNMAETHTAKAYVSADNAQPQIIEDTMSIVGETPVALQYVPGSATIKTNFQDKALSDEIINSGVLIGDDNLNGTMKGCFEYIALVTMKVKVTAPEYTLGKKVSISGQEKYGEEVGVKVGDKVDFMLAFKNTGTTSLKNVVIGDKLPEGFQYVPGTTEWLSGHTSNKWAKVANDNWLAGGVNVGAYGTNGTAFVRFTTTVTDTAALTCGVNKLVNTGYAKPEGQGTIQDEATVNVTKTCAPTPTPPAPTPPAPTPPAPKPTPAYSCDLLETTEGENRTVTIKDFKYNAAGGATFKHAVITWGDGSANLTTNNVVGQTHQYAADGDYKISAVAHFTVNGKDVEATSATCADTVSFTTPVTPAPTAPAPVEKPEVLHEVGAGSVASLFAAVAVMGAAVHRLFFARRLES